MPHPYDIIRRIFNFSQKELDRLYSVMQETHMPKGSTIDGYKHVRQNTYYIMRGAARAYYIRDGKEHTISFAFDDEYLMTHIVLNNVDIPLTIKFMDDSDIIYFSMHRFHNEMQENQESDSVELLKMLNSALIIYNSYLEERVYTLQCMSATERYQWAIERHPMLLEYATITQIASYLGVTKETLYRIRSGKY